MSPFIDLVGMMKASEQRKYLSAIIIYITEQFFRSEIVSKEDAPIASSPVISSAARLVSSFIETNEILKDYIVSSLTRPTIPCLDESLSIRRTIIAALAQDEGQYSKLSLLVRD